jgi:hypothetical protein
MSEPDPRCWPAPRWEPIQLGLIELAYSLVTGRRDVVTEDGAPNRTANYHTVHGPFQPAG